MKTLALILMLLPFGAQAEPSIAATWLIDEQISTGCGASGGEVALNAAIEQDLTGDGKPDVLFSHGGVTCHGDQVQSDYCGAMMCAVMIYVRTGDVLAIKAELLSAGGAAEIETGNPPTIKLINQDGSTAHLRWNGTAFR